MSVCSVRRARVLFCKPRRGAGVSGRPGGVLNIFVSLTSALSGLAGSFGSMQVQSLRPRRAAAGAALDRMRAIHEWERAPESSELFQSVAAAIEAEFVGEELSDDELQAAEESGQADLSLSPPGEGAEATASEGEDDGSDGYESSFIDDDDCSTAESSDGEWRVRKKARVAAAADADNACSDAESSDLLSSASSDSSEDEWDEMEEEREEQAAGFPFPDTTLVLPPPEHLPDTCLEPLTEDMPSLVLDTDEVLPDQFA